MFHYVIAPTLEMRKTPDDKSEVVSQGLFSENIQIIEEQKGWVKIQTAIDGYEGWVKKEGICSRRTPFLHENAPFLIINRLSVHLYSQPDTLYGPVLTVPFESRLLPLSDMDKSSRWLPIEFPDGRRGFVQRGDVSYESPRVNLHSITEFSHFFLGLPYTWGGRSSFGYDCSGFVQMLYRQMGIFLPRDSKDQCKFSGFEDCPIDKLGVGDLIFFGFSPEQIQHVGLALGNGKFIHTSSVTENKPYVRISHVTDPAWNGQGHYPFLVGRKRCRSEAMDNGHYGQNRQNGRNGL